MTFSTRVLGGTLDTVLSDLGGQSRKCLPLTQVGPSTLIAVGSQIVLTFARRLDCHQAFSATHRLGGSQESLITDNINSCRTSMFLTIHTVPDQTTTFSLGIGASKPLVL